MARIAVFVKIQRIRRARAEAQVKEAESAVAGMGVQVLCLPGWHDPADQCCLCDICYRPPDALFVSPDPYYSVRRAQLVTLAARHLLSRPRFGL